MAAGGEGRIAAQERAENVRMAQEEGRTKPVYAEALRQIRAAEMAARNAALDEVAEWHRAEAERKRIHHPMASIFHSQAAAHVRGLKDTPEPER